MHKVTCKYCNIKFDRDIEECVAVGGRRYAHKKCYDEYVKDLSEDEPIIAKKKEENKEPLNIVTNYSTQASQLTQNEIEYLELIEYLKKRFQLDQVQSIHIQQIRKYKEEYSYFTYQGIKMALTWYYDVEKHPIDNIHTALGILPWVYDKAKQYYYKLWLAAEANRLIDIQNYKNKIRVVNIQTPKIKEQRKKEFKLMEDED